MNEKNIEQVKVLKEKLEGLLTNYRLKNDELELATEEWDIAEIQVSLEAYKKDIYKLKKQVRDLEVA